MVDINPDTGLPVLPDGLFYRVKAKENIFAGTLLYVSIRRQHKYWFSTELVGHHYYANMSGTPTQTLQYASRNVLAEYNKNVKAVTAYNLSGDYPPKKLEAN